MIINSSISPDSWYGEADDAFQRQLVEFSSNTSGHNSCIRPYTIGIGRCFGHGIVGGS